MLFSTYAILGLALLSSVRGYAAIPFKREVFEFTTSDGSRLSAQVMVPESPPAGAKLPLWLVFGGFQQAGQILNLIHPRIPAIVASFDYPFTPPRKFEFPGSLRYASELKKTVHATIDGIQALRKKLGERSDIDANRVTLIGASFGAPMATIAAAQDPGFNRLVLVHGFGDVPGTAMHQLVRKWEPQYGWISVPIAWLIARLGWWYLQASKPEDSARALGRHQRSLLITAENDRFVPASASDSLWQALQSSPSKHERIVMPGDHLQPGSDALIEEIMVRIMDWEKGLE